MAVDPYQPFTNPVTGETFRCLGSSEEAYVAEWTVQAGGYVPVEHIHLNQDEIIHVEQGELRVALNAQVQIVGPGQTVTVPRGTRHIACNNKPETLRCVLEYRPGLDLCKLFQCFGGLTLDGDLDRRGVANLAKMAYFMRRMGARSTTLPRFVPYVVFCVTGAVCFLVGRVAGWEKLYRKYTG